MKKGWLVGTGFIAIEHAKVLNGLNISYTAVGRGKGSALEFSKQTGKEATLGGLESFLLSKPSLPDFVINCVPVNYLKESTELLLKYGVKNILLEKPAGIDSQEVKDVAKATSKANAKVYVGYNRRFYNSVIEANKIIVAEGGVTSFNFEFTEWSHVIGALEIDPIIKQNWFFANSSHVVDMAFTLAGSWPKEMFCLAQGSLDWHSKGANFSGSGQTHKGALFSYHANWDAPGRWGIEIMTKRKKLIFRPLERLKIVDVGTVAEYEPQLDYTIDEKYKTGLYRQMKAFLEEDESLFCMIAELQENLIIYESILDGKSLNI